MLFNAVRFWISGWGGVRVGVAGVPRVTGAVVIGVVEVGEVLGGEEVVVVGADLVEDDDAAGLAAQPAVNNTIETAKQTSVNL